METSQDNDVIEDVEEKTAAATAAPTDGSAAYDKVKKDLTLVELAQIDEMEGKGGPAPADAVRPKNNDILFGRGKPFQNHPVRTHI